MRDKSPEGVNENGRVGSSFLAELNLSFSDMVAFIFPEGLLTRPTDIFVIFILDLHTHTHIYTNAHCFSIALLVLFFNFFLLSLNIASFLNTLTCALIAVYSTLDPANILSSI